MDKIRKGKLISKLCMIFAVTLILAGLPFISQAASYPAMADQGGHFKAVIGSNYSASGKAGEDAFIIFDSPGDSYIDPTLISAVSSNTAVVVPELESDSIMSDCLTLYYKKYGKATVTVEDNKGRVTIIEVTVTGNEPRLNVTSATMGQGESKQLDVLYKEGAVTWTSSNKKVATVSSSGKVKAKGKGTCKITATSAGKTFICTVRVIKPRVNFYATLDEYRTRSNCFIVKIRNNGGKPLYITAGTKVENGDYKFLDRKIRLKKKVKISPNKTKYVKFYVRGGVTENDRFNFDLKYKFKFNGKKYNGQVWWSNSQYKTGGKWKSTFTDPYDVYNNWR